MTKVSLSKILQDAGRTRTAGRVKRLATALSSMIIYELLFNVNGFPQWRPSGFKICPELYGSYIVLH